MKLPLYAAALTMLTLTASTAVQADHHALAMHGRPKHDAGYRHFDYVDPEAPKGGRLVLSRTGSFDNLNRYIVRGLPAQGLGLTQRTLLQRSWDEPFTLYALLADRVTMAEDRSWVAFRIRGTAKFHDGSPVTVDDVVFSAETLRRQGRPNHRRYYGEVVEVQRPGPKTVRFHFAPSGNRELPLIMGLMPVLPKAAFRDRAFDRVSLEPIAGAGPYRVDEVDPGRSISYRRIPGHWTEGLPAARGHYNFDTVRYDYYRDEDARHLAFQRAEVDVRRENDPRRWALAYDFPGVHDGRVVRSEFRHGRPAGMYALAWNGRRPPFGDARVRRALGHALDFPWLNRSFYHDAYRRTASYFANSNLAASGLPTAAERALLEPHRAALPPTLFTEPYLPPGAAAFGDLRRRLRLADSELRAAGWVVRDLARVDEITGTPLAFEIMLGRREDERLALTLARNLERLGVEVRVRTVDSAQYQERLDRFDFDAVLYRWGQSLSPGNEQAFYWGSAAADQAGSRNYPGIRDPVVDALVAHLTAAASREDLTAASRALDRALLWGEHVLPLFHSDVDRLAYWDHLARPQRTPLYGPRLETWWAGPAAPRQR
ncbi:MAG: extracellular solute-binding protein [Alphaproteobacteria bacterium]|jgi:ABC-type oligopeptide transport system substrate-binding subunit|nr:extracellular solute-binding protein [Alphaproteobacteria bacterium]